MPPFHFWYAITMCKARRALKVGVMSRIGDAAS